jgi:hypothetical protein
VNAATLLWPATSACTAATPIADAACMKVPGATFAERGATFIAPHAGPPVEGRLLTAQEAAAYLGVARQTLANWRAARPSRGPSSTTARGRVFYRVADLDTWLHDHRNAPSPVR